MTEIDMFFQLYFSEMIHIGKKLVQTLRNFSLGFFHHSLWTLDSDAISIIKIRGPHNFSGSYGLL